MRLKFVLALTLLGLLFVSAPVFGQYFYHQKDMPFGQAAAGGGIETDVSATNRGTFTYNGTLWLYTGNGVPWTTILVNGVPPSSFGSVNISIPPGATVSYRITKPSGPIEAGFGYFFSNDIINDNFLEGNVTYFIRSGATITDSIGVAPSYEFFLSTVAFADFTTIALALNHGDPYGNGLTAHATLTLYNGAGTFVASTPVTLGPDWHISQFLNQFFPSVSLVGPGRLEISTSDYPIFGTALTYTGGQFSSLPLGGAVRAYTFTTSTSSPTVTTSGDASLWSDGFFARGYINFYTLNGSPLANTESYFVVGRYIGTTLRLSFFADQGNTVFGGIAANAYMRMFNFDFSSSPLTDIFVVTWVDNGTPTGPYAYGTSTKGTYTLTRTN
jgi:hypothetical protein